jgi:poly(3-hydroxybutyrate) depolymerase/photosystem II stability/assembly factor-like uncharacterized protein
VPSPQDVPEGTPTPSVPCDSPKGLLEGQTLTVDGKTRTYLLHVPASYDCTKPAPLLVDFHAFTGAKEAEKVYLFDEAVAFAEREGVLLLRPRGLPRPSGSGAGAMTWDVAEEHTAFVDALLAKVESAYAVDPQRRYALGFSNGTYMAMRVLLGNDTRFKGVAVIGGAFRDSSASKVPATSAMRVYASAGYRDPNRLSGFGSLIAEVPAELFFLRETPAGHVFRPFHIEEAWAFLDRGERPSAGSPSAGWSSGVSLPMSVIGIARMSSGWLAYGEGGRFAAVDEDGATTLLAQTKLSWDPIGACRLADGKLLSIDGMSLWISTDVGATFKRSTALPATSYPGSIECYANEVTVFGTPNVYRSTDGGATFEALDSLGDYSFVLGSTKTASGSSVVVGSYGYVARRAKDGAFAPSAVEVSWPSLPLDVNAAAAGGDLVWAVGGGGTVLRSNDDGSTFAPVAVPTIEDLYTVSFRDAQVGAIGGSHGTVLVTRDGGQTWIAKPTGVDEYVGAFAWLSGGRLAALGGKGTVLKTDVN